MDDDTEPISADGKFECQVCGKRVEPTEFHPVEACLEWLALADA